MDSQAVTTPLQRLHVLPRRRLDSLIKLLKPLQDLGQANKAPKNGVRVGVAPQHLPMEAEGPVMANCPHCANTYPRMDLERFCETPVFQRRNILQNVCLQCKDCNTLWGGKGKCIQCDMLYARTP